MHSLGRAFKVLRDTFRGYNVYILILTVGAIASALLDGIGINAFIPLLSFLFGEEGNGLTDNPITTAIRAFFDVLHIPFTFRYLLVFIGVLFLVRALTLALFAYIRARVGGAFMYRETESLFSSTLTSRWPFLSSQKPGYLQNTLYWDVKHSAALLDASVQFIQSSAGFFIYLAVAISISPLVTLVTLGAGFVLLVLLHPLVRMTARFGEQTSMIEKGFVNHLVEHIAGLKSVKASGVEYGVVHSGISWLQRLREIFTKTITVQALSTALIQPFSFIFIIVLFVFAYRLPGFELATFVATLYLIQKIFTYLQSTQASLHSIADQIPYAENIINFRERLQQEQERDQSVGGKVFVFNQELKLTNVSLAYLKDRPALTSVSLSLKQGQLVGLIGPSGGGKTSLADIILRLFSPTEGQVMLDGVPIEDVSIHEWRQRVGYVSQDIFIMDASVSDNIRFYDSQVTDHDIETAAKQAHIYQEIMNLPHGFKTLLGNRGSTLSFGQRQRIVLARALARKPKLLILDEATSALDSESERAIKNAIDGLRGSVTLLVIAHRLATIRDADHLLVLKEGKIVESGTPQEMFARGDSYLSQIQKLQNLKD